MSNIPNNIEKEHIISAIQEIDNSGISNSRRNASEYALLYSGQEYPPKYVISIANKYANNEELSSNDFNSIQSRTFLTNLGFECIKKSDSLKNEFINWLTNNTRNNYFDNDKIRILEALDKYNSFFNIDIFNSDNGVNQLIEFINKNLYSDINSEFFEYSKGVSNHLPRAILGKKNYLTFLNQKNLKNAIINNENKFTWVPTHIAIANYLKDKKNEQHKLIEILKDAGVTGFSDRDINNVDIDLEVIDPFTFFCYIYKYGDSKRLEILQNIAKQLNIHYPKDECGIPSSNAQKVWLFPYKELRVNNEIERLWAFFYEVLDDTISNKSFEDLLLIRGIARTKLTEALFNANPKKYFPINGPTIPYLENVFGINPKFKTFDDYINILNQIQSKTDKPFYQLSYEAWLWNEEQKNKKDMKYWIYAPGRNADFWDEFYEKSIMGLGWDELGDLKQYSSKESIEIKLQELNNVTTSKRNNATANYEFANIMSIGDIVIVKTGRSSLLGYGVVTSDYYFDKTRNIYTSCRKVDWKLKGNWDVQKKLALKTLTDITKYKKDDGTNYYDGLMKIMMNDLIIESKKNTITIPKNQILYGPPGTGKTYKTKELAVQISNPNFIYDINWSIIERREEIVKEYYRLCEKDQIVFTTFHQSMSYEDFVEGIKPKTVKTKITYDVEDGVFKLLSDKAKDNWEANNKRFEKELAFDSVFSKLREEWEEDDSIKFPMKTDGNDFTIIGFTNKSIQFKKASGGTSHTLSINTLRNIFYDESKNRTTGVGIYYPPILAHLKKYKTQTDIPVTLNNYVLIIDEINRGNVSAIFGELITLLEDDKRIGQKEAIKITLPYSKDEFGVPSNLYIIGTMNTADRSVEALDTALRRRFSFTEVAPNSELLQGKEVEEIELKKLLETINDRIELLIDKDHKIGHSYFLNIKTLEDLKQTFKNKVIPLLEEYFFGDYGKIGLVLGDGFIKLKDDKDKISFAKNFTEKYEDAENLREKAVYTFTYESSWDKSTFISIYEQ
jgi:5-methylcytosine-specific restriction protein B